MGFDEELEATKRSLIAEQAERYRQEDVAFREGERKLIQYAQTLNDYFGEGRISFVAKRDASVPDHGGTLPGIVVLDQFSEIGAVFLNPLPDFRPYEACCSSESVGPHALDDFREILKRHLLDEIAKSELELEQMERNAP